VWVTVVALQILLLQSGVKLAAQCVMFRYDIFVHQQ